MKRQHTHEAHNNENDFHHEILRTYNRLADGGKEYTIEDARRRAVLELWSLRVLAIVFLLFLGWLLVGCSTKKVVEYVPVEKKTVETVVLKDTVLQIQLVPYKDSVSVRDSASYLENPYAYSRASVRNGMLSHTLGIFPLKSFDYGLKIPFRFIRDSIPYPVPGPVQYVEKPLSAVEKTLMGAGMLAIGGGIMCGVFALRRFVS